MSLLSRKIDAAVDAQAQAGPGAVTAAEGPHRLTLQLTAASPVGVAFDALEFASEGEGTGSSLRAWGDRLAARLTYLMEPLVVLEVDDEAGQAELRSKAPSARDGVRSYYEVRLRRPGTLGLRRVAFDDGGRQRNPIPCQLTREALDRLADDLIASLA